jgi:hypothetical protein
MKFLSATLIAAACIVGSTISASAQERDVLCELSCPNGGRLTPTDQCKCYKSTKIPKPCALVCWDGRLDAKRCRCVPNK